MIFEDNDKSKLGALLKRCFNGENLYFAGSNTRIFKEVKRATLFYEAWYRWRINYEVSKK